MGRSVTWAVQLHGQFSYMGRSLTCSEQQIKKLGIVRQIIRPFYRSHLILTRSIDSAGTIRLIAVRSATSLGHRLKIALPVADDSIRILLRRVLVLLPAILGLTFLPS